MKKPKFTFKKQKAQTGLMGVGHPYPDTDIKLNKMSVGYIGAPCWNTKDHKWGVHLMFESEDGQWMWKAVKQRFDSEPDARVWLQERVEALIKQGLHSEEPDED